LGGFGQHADLASGEVVVDAPSRKCPYLADESPQDWIDFHVTLEEPLDVLVSENIETA
jgi:hypothetical protein